MLLLLSLLSVLYEAKCEGMQDEHRVLIINTVVRVCEVHGAHRVSANEHTHAPHRMLDHETESSHNCRNDGKQFST